MNLLFLLVHCLCNDAETTGRLSAGSPTTSTLQNSPSCDWSLDFVNKKKKKKECPERRQLDEGAMISVCRIACNGVALSKQPQQVQPTLCSVPVKTQILLAQKKK